MIFEKIPRKQFQFSETYGTIFCSLDALLRSFVMFGKIFLKDYSKNTIKVRITGSIDGLETPIFDNPTAQKTNPQVITLLF